MTSPSPLRLAGRLCKKLRLLLVLSFIMGTGPLANTALAQTNAPVAITESATEYVLSNGILTARVLKHNGDLASLKFRDTEILTDKSGHAGAYWSHDTTGGTELITRITINPATNGGARAEVSVKGISGGKRMGHGPGVPAGAEGNLPVDIEIRYMLGRGESGIYTYCAFMHRPEYPAATMTEARFAAKLADTFDWMTVDANRDKHFPVTLREGDKYIYTANQFENRAFGWSSTKDRIGFWLLNPSTEYLSGGPTKTEFLAHRDTTPVAAPIIFNYWRSSHYGGALVEIGAGELWTKVIGPFYLYVNSGGDPKALAADARARQAKEASQWPYEWVAGVDYARSAERATVKGRFKLEDPHAKSSKLPNLLVGLTPATYTSPVSRPGPNGAAAAQRQIDWQIDAKHNQFWAHGSENGSFSIPHVPAGTYTLRALADGVLGEFAQADVVVKTGQPLELGSLAWKPVRHGKPLWEIGVPNRTASEFAGADQFWVPEMPLKYATLFANDVNFVIGKSDPRRDWFFQHVPHNENPDARSLPFRGISTPGRATPYAISFNSTDAPHGKAILRVAICGGGAREVDVAVNGKSVGKIDRMRVDGAITRHSIRGLWFEREVPFDAALLRAGENTLTLTVPAGPVNNGVIYDYVRLELDPSL
jgi:rhamnogalacturonan endolyase